MLRFVKEQSRTSFLLLDRVQLFPGRPPCRVGAIGSSKQVPGQETTEKGGRKKIVVAVDRQGCLSIGDLSIVPESKLDTFRILIR
jgi:hypothetical protein